MFTGLVAAVGKIVRVQGTAGGVRISIDPADLAMDDVAAGGSIAVDGVCLTVIDLPSGCFEVEASSETLRCTTGFGESRFVNLEKALRWSDRLGGHLVTGHVDGVGEVTRFDEAGDNRLVTVEAPRNLARYIAHKGSIAVNGVSLTVNAVGDADFSVNLIPVTLRSTNLCRLKPGDRVNVETDMLARYVERLHQFDIKG